MLKKKLTLTVLPIALVGTIILAGCSQGQNVPGSVPGINEVTKPAPKNPKPTNTTPSENDKEDVREIDEDTGIPEVKEEDIVTVKEGESEQQASVFFKENLFGINPETILIPNDVKESFAENAPENIPNAVLAMLSDSASKSVLQNVSNSDNQIERNMLLQSFADSWLTGDATNKFYDARKDYEGNGIGKYPDLFSLIPLSTPENLYKVGGKPFTTRNTSDAWLVQVNDLTVDSITSNADNVSPLAKVTYTKTTWVPVVDSDKNEKTIQYIIAITLYLEPGLHSGDWLISDYSQELLN